MINIRYVATLGIGSTPKSISTLGLLQVVVIISSDDGIDVEYFANFDDAYYYISRYLPEVSYNSEFDINIVYVCRDFSELSYISVFDDLVLNSAII